MLAYVAMELAEGALPDGSRYISRDVLLARRAPQVTIGKSATYGMGLTVDTTYGVSVVHHGGVGTTSQGLLAGVPTLIVPFAFDQSDNAEHARRIGTSRTLYRKNYLGPRVATELHELLTQPAYVRRAIEISQNLKLENGPGRAADLIEEATSVRRNSPEELAYASRN